MKNRMITLAILFFLHASCRSEPVCSIVNPMMGHSSFGLILLPESGLKGTDYTILTSKINEAFEERMWIGIPEDYTGDLPTIEEVELTIQDCISKATELGANTSVTYLSGHGLGGQLALDYVLDVGTNIDGLILYGSYSQRLVYPPTTPTLLATGSLDGLALAHLRTEVAKAENEENILTVVAVNDVNHSGLSNGVLPASMEGLDIQSDCDLNQANEAIASVTFDFFVKTNPEYFGQDQVDVSQWNMERNLNFTMIFISPFEETALSENTNDLYSPWVSECEEELLNLNAAESLIAESALATSNIFLDFDAFLNSKPSYTSVGCTSNVSTYAFPIYTEQNETTVSTTYMKAKFKVSEVILESLCFPPRPARQCKDLNEAAFDLALSKASTEAVNRYRSHGKQLVFIDDYLALTGPTWAYSEGLEYSEIGNSTVTVKSTSLVTGTDLPIHNLEGMHYCDIMTPYRALEWIYITSLQQNVM